MKNPSLVLCMTLLLASCGKTFKNKSSETATRTEDVQTAVTLSQAPPASIGKENEQAEKGSYAFATYASSGSVAANGGATFAGMSANASRADNTGLANPTYTVSTQPAPTRVETKIPTKIIRNAHISFQVDSTDRSHRHITELLGAYQAYFGSDSREQTTNLIQQNMVIRVPAEHFDALVEALMKESIYTNSKNITADDVTAEFVDVEARLKSKKEVEKRYMELLARAQKVTDVIEVESNLRIIREEVESMEGRLKLLKNQVGYSTINLDIYQKINGEIQPETGMAHRIKEALVNGWRGLEFFILALINMWPLLIAGGIAAVWIWMRIRRKKA